jgi:Domain of Unknown Function with PDB structure (DUF3857)
MKKITLVYFFLLLHVAIWAQDKLPSFGKIDKADLEMKDCSFDPGAEAFVLIDYGDIRIDYGQNTNWTGESTFRVRCKVLKEKGISRAAITLRYQSDERYEDINSVKGISFNLGANGEIEETVLDKKSIYTKQIDKNFSEISFALPNVRVGSVFEYQFKLTRKSYRHIPAWTFQQRIPVRYSAYNVSVPSFFKYTTQIVVRQALDKKVDEGDNWFIMRNIPGLKDEPYSSGREDYLQRIEFQLSEISVPGYVSETVMSTWPKLTEELLANDYFGGELKKNIRGASDLNTSLAVAQSGKDKIKTVYNYVQTNMQWNGEYGLFSEGIKSAWDKKNGSLTDINFILISLLKDAGIKAKPLLISTKDNGTVNTLYPFLNQFNGVMVYVKDGENVYVMNAADKYNPYNLVPYDVIFTNALLVDKNEGGLVELYADGSFKHTIYFTCAVDPGGKITGQANIMSAGYARNVRLETISKKKLREVFENNNGININVDSMLVTNENDESVPLAQKADFSGSIQSGGEYLFLPCDLFTGMGKNLFIEENRVMDIDFYYPRSYVINGTYFLPDDFIVNELPKNTRLIMPDTSIALSRIIQLDGQTISFKITLDVKAFGYAAESYPYVKDFFKKMYAILEERIVLKKK